MSVEVKNVCFSYDGKKPVLTDVSLKAKNGWITAICGNNATGKSTLAKLICGLISPTSGSIICDDKPGLVMQNPEEQLFEDTVLKDVMFGPVNLKLENAEQLAKEALKEVGLEEETWNKDPFTLSGGQMRRCAIAGVLAMNRTTIVFDESSAGLDKKALDLYFDILKKEKAKGHTVITITHNQKEIDLADKVYCLE